MNRRDEAKPASDRRVIGGHREAVVGRPFNLLAGAPPSLRDEHEIDAELLGTQHRFDHRRTQIVAARIGYEPPCRPAEQLRSAERGGSPGAGEYFGHLFAS